MSGAAVLALDLSLTPRPPLTDRTPITAVTITFSDGTTRTFHGTGYTKLSTNHSHPGEKPATSWVELDAHMTIDKIETFDTFDTSDKIVSGSPLANPEAPAPGDTPDVIHTGVTGNTAGTGNPAEHDTLKGDHT